MIEGFDAAGGASVDWLVVARTGRVVDAGTDWPETVLMSQPYQVGQLVRRHFRSESHKVLAGCRWLGSSDFHIIDRCDVTLKSVLVTSAFFFSVGSSDNSTQQTVDLHDGAAAKVYVARINFAGKSTWSSGGRCLVDVNSRILVRRSEILWNKVYVGDNADIKPGGIRIRASVIRFDSLTNQIPLGSGVGVLTRVYETCVCVGIEVD